MDRIKNKVFFYLTIMTIVFLSLAYHSSYAVIDACSVSVSPSQLNINTSGTLSFSLTNGSSETVGRWVKFSAPTQDFEVLSGNASGWPASVESPMEIVFRNGSIAPGASVNFNINVQTGVKSVAPASWGVSVSDDTGGNGATGCTGETGVAIIGPDFDKTSPVISNIGVIDIKQTSVTVTWETNEDASSVVEYGETAAYGSMKENTNLKKSHSITLTDLTADTSYHFVVKSADSSNNVGVSSDNTFTTIKNSDPPSETPEPAPDPEPEDEGGGSSHDDKQENVKPTVKPKPKKSISPSPQPAPEVESDRVAPRVYLTTDLSIPYETAPVIKGRAVDEGGFSRIQYSLDGGINWVNIGNKNNSSSINFSFTPLIKKEGSFQVVVRAVDYSGNIGTVRAKMVIDRYAPLVGPAMVSYGPLVLVPDEKQVFTVTAGVDIKVNFSASGGPETIDLFTVNGPDKEKQLFSLAHNTETGLWFGVLSFSNPGDYKIKIKAKDGAEKETERTGLYFRVLKKNTVLDSKGEKIESGEATVFVRDRISKKYVRWDSLPFGVSNPLQVSDQGEFPLILPTGEYYLLLNVNGIQSRTGIFINDRTKVVSGILKLPYKKEVTSCVKKIVSKIWPGKASLVFAEQDFGKEFGEEVIVGRKLPNFTTVNDKGEVFSVAQIKKPGVLVFVAPWSPETPEQLKNINLSGEKESVMSVFVQSSDIEANILKERGGYDVATMSDDLGNMVEPFKLNVLPMSVFFDKDGVVKKSLAGVISSERLRSEVGASRISK